MREARFSLIFLAFFVIDWTLAKTFSSNSDNNGEKIVQKLGEIVDALQFSNQKVNFSLTNWASLNPRELQLFRNLQPFQLKKAIKLNIFGA